MPRKYIVVSIFFIAIIIPITSFAQRLSPVIKSVVPKIGLAYKETLLTVEGENIFQGARVIIGEKHSATIAFFPSKKIVVYSPPRAPGVVDITVINPDGQSYTMKMGFLYVTKLEQVREEGKTSSLDTVADLEERNNYKNSLKSLLRPYKRYVVKVVVYGGIFIFLFIVLSMNRKNRLIKKINKEKKKYFCIY